MVTVKLGELQGIMIGLNDIVTKELPIKPAYWFSKLAKKVDREFRELEEARMKLIDKYALRDEKGELIVKENKYQLSDQAAFNAEFKELAETEIAIDFKPLLLDQLGDIKISAITLNTLEKFIIEADLPC